jgi:polysaccharide chain length determinant protein (PEP-CTERM system associated)
MENRELTLDDYLAMLRRRMKVILIPALLAPLAGFLVSYVFSAKYTSQALVLITPPKIPDAVVQQVFTEDLTQHITTIQQRVLSPSQLRPMVEKLGLAKGSQNVDDVISDIQLNMMIEPVPDISEFGGNKPRRPGQNSSVPGFYVNYTASTAKEAKDVCTELTSMLLEEDLKSRQDATQGTTFFLTKQVEDAKQNLDDMDKKLAAFKNQHMGQLPEDEDNNLKILMGLNSQLDANTQTLNRANQDKSYTESLLTQQLAAWKAAQSANNPQTLQQQLSQLQAELIDLQGRYTDDHPDVIKTKTDIAEVKKELAAINNGAAAGSTDSANEKGSATEPPEIRQLRLQVHQYEDLLSQTTKDQRKLQQEIAVYQSRVASSPAVEEEYKELARDYDNAQKVYQDDLAKQSKSKMASQAEQQQQGEQMGLLNPANMPDSPSFPNRLLFAGGGLGAGLVLGLGLAFWLEFRDKCIRTEPDAEAALELPVLVAVPWVMQAVPENGNGHFWNRKKPEQRKETAKA